MGHSHGLIVYLFLFLISFAFTEAIPIALLPCLCKFESVLNTNYPLECHTSLFLCLLNMCIHISHRHLHPCVPTIEFALLSHLDSSPISLIFVNSATIMQLFKPETEITCSSFFSLIYNIEAMAKFY